MMPHFTHARAVRFLSLALLALAVTRMSSPAADDAPANVIAILKGHGETVYSIAFTPDGKYAVTGSFDKSIKLWEVPSGKDVRTYTGAAGHKDLILSVAFSPDGKSIASGSQDNTAKLWDVPTSGSVLEFVNNDP